MRNQIRKKFLDLILSAAAAVVVLGIFVLNIETLKIMPDYALVFLDDRTETYIAAPCLDEWLKRPDKDYAVVRRSTAKEAYRLHYKVDDDCREAGGYIEDGPTFFDILLVKLGIISPAKYWWDAPYRTEEGQIMPNT